MCISVAIVMPSDRLAFIDLFFSVLDRAWARSCPGAEMDKISGEMDLAMVALAMAAIVAEVVALFRNPSQLMTLTRSSCQTGWNRS